MSANVTTALDHFSVLQDWMRPILNREACPIGAPEKLAFDVDTLTRKAR
jgi:hypothetical protein